MLYRRQYLIMYALLNLAAWTTARIIGGVNATEGQIPYQVSLRHKGIHVCGATLSSVNETIQIIVTAAHCVDSGLTYTALAGTIYRLPNNDSIGQERKVKTVIIHQEYNGWTAENDIALLLLEVPFNTSDQSHTQPLPLPSYKQLTTGNVIISGWGRDKSDENLKDILKMFEVPVVDNTECQIAFAETAAVTASMICAGTGYKDSCFGDAGGPVAGMDGNESYLAGIISWGYECGDLNHPAVHTKVSYFTDWIHSQVKESLAST